MPKDLLKNPQNQIFIKQLIDVEDIEENEIDEMIKFTSFRYAAQNSLKRFIKNEATIDDEKSFKRDIYTKWDNKHKSIYKKKVVQEINGLAESEKRAKLIELGHNCLSAIREIPVYMDNSKLPTDVENGHFYWLSDLPEIGWRLDWEKYKTEINGKA